MSLRWTTDPFTQCRCGPDPDGKEFGSGTSDYPHTVVIAALPEDLDGHDAEGKKSAFRGMGASATSATDWLPQRTAESVPANPWKSRRVNGILEQGDPKRNAMT